MGNQIAMPPTYRPILYALTSALISSASAALAQDFDFFEANIRPVLAERCYACHSSKSQPVQAGLAVDTRDGLLRGGRSGVPAIVPGKPEESLLIKALNHSLKDLKMPPGPQLPAAQLQAFTEWVKRGAPDPRTEPGLKIPEPTYDWDKERKHWAYQPIQRTNPPATHNPEWSRTEIDRFLIAKLDEKNLHPLGRAPKQAVIRRVTYNLTGLPPTPEEVQSFVADVSPQAFEKVIDRLLASREYAEHWGRHWLDLVRYADTAGDASDFPVPEMYRYRDYVIRSIQSDKPFDQFLREQIAGDILEHRNDEDRREKLIATSYIANSRRFGQTMGEHFLTVDDTVDNLSKAVLGLSVGCARCHDHKFDPIPTKDYYALTGIFDSTKYAHAGLEHHQYLQNFHALNTADEPKEREIEARMFELHRIVKKGVPPMTDDAAKQLEFFKAADELTKLRRDFPVFARAYGAMEGTPRNARVLVKGDPAMKGPEVPRGFLTILGGQKVPSDYKGSGRDLLAGWILDPGNPLTSRVLVNRVWLWHFGRGIVNTPNDFGARGEKPTHPELLDWLASTFQNDGWSLKKLHKRILMTRAYQNASGHNEANFDADPRNELYWKFDRRRLAAEEIRDTLLAVTDQLDRTQAGPHPFPPRGTYVYTQHKPFIADLNVYDTNRRSVYLIQQRFRRHPYLELFDGPDPNNTTASRPNNLTALQSLYFFNNEFVHKHADALAVRVGMADLDVNARMDRACRLLFGRSATPVERQEAAKLYAQAVAATHDNRSALASLMRVLISSNEFFFLD